MKELYTISDKSRRLKFQLVERDINIWASEKNPEKHIFIIFISHTTNMKSARSAYKMKF